MIFDLFMYSGEEDILDIRLHTLAEIVDVFVIFESKLSHSLIPKPLFFLDQKSRFDKFKDKIVYLTGESNHPNSFVNDWAGRMALFDYVSAESDENILIHSDNDEIPNPDKLKEVIDNLIEPVNMSGDYFFGCVDLWGRLSNDALIMKRGWCNQEFYKYRDARNSPHIKRVEKASWHFSSVGRPEEIAQKWTYFAHHNEIDNKYKDPEYIKSQIRRKAASWDENEPKNGLKLIEHTYPNLPRYLLENKLKFQHLFYEYYL